MVAGRDILEREEVAKEEVAGCRGVVVICTEARSAKQ